MRRRTNWSIAANSLRLLVAIGFATVSGQVSLLQAQPAAAAAPLSASPVLVTNLLQLSQALGTASRIVADLRLEVQVRSSSRPEMGVVAVSDNTGSEVLELGSLKAAVAPGALVRIEGERCLLRRRELGIEITRAPVLDNDSMPGFRRVSGRVWLAAGLHDFQLDYFNLLGRASLELTCQPPNGAVQGVERFLVRPDDAVAPTSNTVPGLAWTRYEGTWQAVPDFTLWPAAGQGTATSLGSSFEPEAGLFGIRFEGKFAAPVDGTYTFNMTSDDGSLLFLGEAGVSLVTVGRKEIAAPPEVRLFGESIDVEVGKWMSLDGRVTFITRIGLGLGFELQAQHDSIWVQVADAGDLDPAQLLNSRIRVAGVGRAVLSPGSVRVPGELSTTATDNIVIVQAAPGREAANGSIATITAIEGVQSLSREEAAGRIAVRIRGVVTSVGPREFRFMSVQDETRGIFVRVPVPREPFPSVGQVCEVIGHTDSGYFAPVVVAEELRLGGRGQLPLPVRPSWRELLNGSLDAQWVELQGLVTSVKGNKLSLLLPEGELEIEAEARAESQLKSFEQAVVRARGVLFAVWTNRTVQVGRLLMRNMSVNVDAPSPRDPFDLPLKSWSELYQFDSRATLFQRVKVRGTVVYADSRWVFVMDRARGIRVSLVEPAILQYGEVVEVVGYPDISGPAPLLREAVLRKTNQNADPIPLILDEDQLMLDKVDSMLVQITATLIGIRSEQRSQVMEMNTGGHLFLARMPWTIDTSALRIGSRLTLTGVCVGKVSALSGTSKPTEFELLLSSTSQLTVRSRPAWWTPRRLLIVVGLFLVVLTFAAIWISQLRRVVEYRSQQLQLETRERETAERERALEAERSRIARDLHDDLGSSLTEIGMLASKGRRARTMEELTELFRSISSKARGLVTALDSIVWAVDPEDNSLESVADYLSDFAGEYLSHSEIACRFDVPVALPSITLDGRLRHDLLLAVKETLNNVERHARATEVEFRMAFFEGRLQIVISDNGRGFDTEKKYQGNGLKNLPLRLSRLGGRYHVQSTLGSGTTVTIELQLPRSEDEASAIAPPPI